MKMPVIFSAHGSPMNAITTNDFTISLKNFGNELLQPDAILCISAHWQTKGTKILGHPHPKIIYDFYGFPKELYKIEYPASGAQKQAARLKQLLPQAEIVQSWGLDHGTWSVLIHLFPKANIPVFQLSLDINLSEEEHFKLATNLYSLRKEKILIVGSGNIVHNLQQIKMFPGAQPYKWNLEFDEQIKDAILNHNTNAIINYKKFFKNTADLAVPTNEHYLPLIYCMSCADSDDHVEFIFEGYEHGSISMRSIVWS